MEKARKKKREPIWLVAVVLAWLIPGAGHIYVGRVRRGLILFVAIAAVFWAGLAMGGVMTVDRPYERWWWTAQMLTGVHGLASWQRSEQIYDELRENEAIQLEAAELARTMRGVFDENKQIVFRPTPEGQPDPLKLRVDQVLSRWPDGKETRSIVPGNPTAGIARAYSGIAGMLNLMVIFDALMLCIMGITREPRRKPRSAETKDGQP